MSRLWAHQQGDCDSGSCSFCAEEELHDLWLHEQGECRTGCAHCAEERDE